jgi:hypothetical protein
LILLSDLNSNCKPSNPHSPLSSPLTASQHSAVSSLEACTTPARQARSRPPRPAAEGRHPTTLNSGKPGRVLPVLRLRAGILQPLTVSDGQGNHHGRLVFGQSHRSAAIARLQCAVLNVLTQPCGCAIQDFVSDPYVFAFGTTSAAYTLSCFGRISA